MKHNIYIHYDNVKTFLYTQELSSVTDTLNFLKSSQEALSHANSKEDVKRILDSFTTDPALQAFLSSNLQTKQGVGAIGYEWKYHVNALVDGIPSILSFPTQNTFNGPTVVVKAGNSNFVKSRHVEPIKRLFPDYRIVTIRDCGHWLHSEKPAETASILARFIEYTESKSS